ncbi:uncharacterized protein [Clytia hemisphaerica]|uniref:Cnidarian restricted protein n=1 Tax=Clytia hemisphaerica TaxID=252671 RepID=A0A7M5XF12_9CNID
MKKLLNKLIFLALLWQHINCIYTGCDEEARKWCEQSQCSTGCKCLNKPVCKQACTTEQCSELTCSSHKVCRQSVIPPTNSNNGKPLVTVHIQSLIARAPNIEQSCSLGICDNMTALKVDGQISKALQVCNGRCNKILSNVDYTRQLAVQTDLMQCVNTTVCDQVCVIGRCQMMYCNSKECKQRCSVGSQCQMTCGPHTKVCEQTCEMNSSCQITCLGENCRRECKDAELCEIMNSNRTFEKWKSSNSSTTKKSGEVNNNTLHPNTTHTPSHNTETSFLASTTTGHSGNNMTENSSNSTDHSTDSPLKPTNPRTLENNITKKNMNTTTTSYIKEVMTTNSKQTDHKKEALNETDIPITETGRPFIGNTTDGDIYHLVNGTTTNLSMITTPNTHFKDLTTNQTTSLSNSKNHSKTLTTAIHTPSYSPSDESKTTNPTGTSVGISTSSQQNISDKTRKPFTNTPKLTSKRTNSLLTSARRASSTPKRTAYKMTTDNNTSSRGFCIKYNILLFLLVHIHIVFGIIL